MYTKLRISDASSNPKLAVLVFFPGHKRFSGIFRQYETKIPEYRLYVQFPGRKGACFLSETSGVPGNLHMMLQKPDFYFTGMNVTKQQHVLMPGSKKVFFILLFLLSTLNLMAQDTSKFLSAKDSDPKNFGWMQGFPPPENRVLHTWYGSFFEFPAIRWSVVHMRELLPTKNVSRGLNAPSSLEFKY